ncbi:MAG: M56 family metallopeptidase, partial [Planctomycetota bacterium]
MTKSIVESLWWLAAGCTMLHFLWVGGAIGLFALGGRRILRRASLSINYAFTLCCLLALITAPVVLFAYVVDRMKDTRPTPAGTWAAEQEQDEDLWLLMENAAPLVKNDEVATAMQNPEPAGRETLATSIMTSISSVLPWMWITGTPVLLSIVMLGLAGAYRLRRRARLLHDEPTAKLGAHLAKVLGLGKVEIGLSDRIVSPTVVGIVHPLILLPEVALRQWRSDHVRMILLHELWHVRRLDNLMNLVQRFIESVMFF